MHMLRHLRAQDCPGWELEKCHVSIPEDKVPLVLVRRIALMLRSHMRKTVLTGIWGMYSFPGIVKRMCISLPENSLLWSWAGVIVHMLWHYTHKISWVGTRDINIVTYVNLYLLTVSVIGKNSSP